MTLSRHIAFFGATGGATNACLALALEHGHSATALARSPDKLRLQLKARKVSDGVLDSRLRIVQGDVKNVDVVEETLRASEGGDAVVDTIICGIGGVATPQFSLFRPLTLADPSICSDAVNTILTVLSQDTFAQHEAQPLFVALSAIGVRDEGPRDYPLLLTVLVRWLLRGVFDDKRSMEAALEKTRPEGGYLIVRPSVLTNSGSRGVGSIRQGTTEHPVIGYTISRDDVGKWLYEHVVQTPERDSLRNTGVNITY